MFYSEKQIQTIKQVISQIQVKQAVLETEFNGFKSLVVDLEMQFGSASKPLKCPVHHHSLHYLKL